MKSLKDNIDAVIDLTMVLMIGIAFAALMVIAYIIFEVKDQLDASGAPSTPDTTGINELWRSRNLSLQNVTFGFDNAVNLLLIAITIFILAIAISALLMLRGR